MTIRLMAVFLCAMNNVKKEKDKISKKNGETKIIEESDQTKNPGKDELKFVRIIDPNSIQLIPVSLFEQIKDNDFDYKKLYEYAPLLMTQIGLDNNGQVVTMPNRFQHFYILFNSKHRVKGLLWFSIDPLREVININALTIDKEYQGSELKKIKSFMQQFKEQEKAKKILWSTTRPRAYERVGARRTNYITMEL